MVPSRVKAPEGLLSSVAKKMKSKKYPSAFMQAAEGLSCLNWKESEEVIMLSK